LKYIKIYSKYSFIKKRKIHQLIKSLSIELEFVITSLEINFISEDRIKKINSEYLNHHNSTDIITFNYSEQLKSLDGEIFISIDDAIENSKKFNVSLSEEIARLIIHGILHLIGFDDQNKKDKIKMKRQENKLLNTLKFILL
jgi:probable rRNA maturation factor